MLFFGCSSSTLLLNTGHCISNTIGLKNERKKMRQVQPPQMCSRKRWHAYVSETLWHEENPSWLIPPHCCSLGRGGRGWSWAYCPLCLCHWAWTGAVSTHGTCWLVWPLLIPSVAFTKWMIIIFTEVKEKSCELKRSVQHCMFALPSNETQESRYCKPKSIQGVERVGWLGKNWVLITPAWAR